MKLSVLIATTGRRDVILAETERAFHETTWHVQMELLTIAGHSWGEGCNRLAAKATGDVLMFGADDQRPESGWLQAGMAELKQGRIPAVRLLSLAGEPLGPVDILPAGEPVTSTRLHLITPEIWGKVGRFLDQTWYADEDYSARLIAAGYPIVSTPGFLFTHLEGEHDWQTPEVMAAERDAWEAIRAE